MPMLGSEKHGFVKAVRSWDKIFPVFICLENTLAFSAPANPESHLVVFRSNLRRDHWFDSFKNYHWHFSLLFFRQIFFVIWLYGEKVLDLKNQADMQESIKPSRKSCKNANAEGIEHNTSDFHIQMWIKSEFSLWPIENCENMSII